MRSCHPELNNPVVDQVRCRERIALHHGFDVSARVAARDQQTAGSWHLRAGDDQSSRRILVVKVFTMGNNKTVDNVERLLVFEKNLELGGAGSI